MLHLSDTFVISAGTVAIDLSKGLVLILYSPHNGTYFLPKGRKDFGETITDAAIRETFEESGYHVKLLAHSLPSNATRGHSRHLHPNQTRPNPEASLTNHTDGLHISALGTSTTSPCTSPGSVFPDRDNIDSLCGDLPIPGIVENASISQQEQSSRKQRHIEPIAVQQRAYSDSYKMIFWYLAEVDSEMEPENSPKEAWEDYEVHWTPVEEAVRKVTREEDGKLIEWALMGARAIRAERSGAEI